VSDVLSNDVDTVCRVAQPCRPPTILGGTELVEVPHYEFAVSRTSEDLVVIAWVLAEIEFFPRGQDLLPRPQATSVLTLSIFSPLPVHKLRDASRRWPPRPTADL
jgi:hypothetical protein